MFFTVLISDLNFFFSSHGNPISCAAVVLQHPKSQAYRPPRSTPTLSLQRANEAGGKFPKERPLVLLLSWLAAKPRHLDNFAAFYLSRGCDVLTVKLRPMQVNLQRNSVLVHSLCFIKIKSVITVGESGVFFHHFVKIFDSWNFSLSTVTLKLCGHNRSTVCFWLTFWP